MPAPTPSVESASTQETLERPRTRVVTLVFTDMANSTALKHRLGDRASAALFQKHHHGVRETLARFPAGQEIETAGDSFMLAFSTPSDAVQFALLLQARLRELNRDSETHVSDRIGVHLGEVITDSGAPTSTPKDLYGIQIDVCARVMSLANGGQILMTRAVFDSARQVLKGEDIPGVGQLEWFNHGAYRLKGLEEPVEICEVREAGQSTTPPPVHSEKAHKQTVDGKEQVLGWRPAVGQFVPNTRWQLDQKLGEGGFGEVWLGRHQHTKEGRVFKFCFHAERVRFLKREMTLFRLLKERIGEHPHLVRLYDFYLEEPPYYVEMDYVAGRDLASWCKEQGGVDSVPIKTRLQLVAEAAEGLQAAHEAGIIHRDIKPANILIAERETRNAESAAPRSAFRDPSPVVAKLTDFGIGQVVSEEFLKGITRAGFTQTILADSSSSGTGTQLYMAPELLAGKPATVRSDIYSLGVVLYQLLVGDMTRPVTTDWAKRITDELWREDLERCFAGEPADRFGSAAELAKNLRALPERRAARELQAAAQMARERAAYRRGVMRTAAVAAVLVSVFIGLSVYALRLSRLARGLSDIARHEQANAEKARQIAERDLYVAKMKLCQQAWEHSNFRHLRRILDETSASPHRGVEWFYWWKMTHLAAVEDRGHTKRISSLMIAPDEMAIYSAGEDGTVRTWSRSDPDGARRAATLADFGDAIHAAALSGDGARMLTGHDNGAAWLLDANTGQILREFRHSGPVLAVAISGDNLRLATAGRDYTTKIWDANTGRQLAAIKVPESWGPFEYTAVFPHPTAVDFSPDGRRLAIGYWSGDLAEYDAATGEIRFRREKPQGSLQCVRYSPDGRIIAAVGAADVVWLIESQTGKLLKTISFRPWIESVAFSPTGIHLAATSADGVTRVWNVASGAEIGTWREAFPPVAFQRDGKGLIAQGRDNTLRRIVLDHDDGIRLLSPGHRGSVRTLSWSPDGTSIFTGADDSTAWVSQRNTFEPSVAVRDPHGLLGVSAWTHDSHYFLTGGSDGKARLWRSRDGGLVRTFEHGGAVRCVAAFKDGRRIFTASMDGHARVWDLETGQILRQFSPGVPIVTAALSPDETRVALSGSVQAMAEQGRGVSFWDPASGTQTSDPPELGFSTGSLSFSPDSKRLLVSHGSSVRLWDCIQNRMIGTFEGHAGNVTFCLFWPDSTRVVTGAGDGSVKIWDPASFQETLHVRGRGYAVYAGAVSPDGKSLAWSQSRINDVNLIEFPSPGEVKSYQQSWQQWDDSAREERLRMEAQKQRETKQLSTAPGVVRDWLVLAPIMLSATELTEAAVDLSIFTDEQNLRPRAGDRVQRGEKEWVWREYSAPGPWLNFDQPLGSFYDYAYGYAITYVESERNHADAQARLASDDQCVLYLNGQEIFRWIEVSMMKDDRFVIHPVALKEGQNIVVFKVINGVRRWSCSLRFTDAAGQPLQGLRIANRPDPSPR